MSDTKKLAERIAKLLETEQQVGDLASVFASLEKINHRLDKLEGPLNLKSQILNPKSTHPSQEKFAVLEAVADQVIEGLKNEKACTFEPNGKPCDHCSMCSSRGF
ncbi:MAG TPA: hypothetical protein VL572_08285 [Pyrinomonadaceae bacterium]|jgi:hypothetical protein|nr:hypothetical protein [Pyrinomonadaceae bacterium]